MRIAVKQNGAQVNVMHFRKKRMALNVFPQTPSEPVKVEIKTISGPINVWVLLNDREVAGAPKYLCVDGSVLTLVVEPGLKTLMLVDAEDQPFYLILVN